MDMRREKQKVPAVCIAQKMTSGKLHLGISLTGFVFMAVLFLLKNCSMTIGPGNRYLTFIFIRGYMLCHPVAMITGSYLAVMLLLSLMKRQQAQRWVTSSL